MAGVHQMLLGSGASYVFRETIAVGVQNYNLKARALAAGWDGLRPLAAEVTVSPGVVVGSATTAGYAFDTGAGFPAGTQLSLVNHGTIVGAGGAGGVGAVWNWGTHTASPAGAGGAGGVALRAQAPIRIANAGIVGGGGGGGGGGNVQSWYSGDDTGVWGGGSGGRGAGHAGYAIASGQPGLVGEGSYAGGSGGGLGAPGGSGAGGGVAGGGGAGGACTSGNGNITWLATGTRYGALN